MIESVAVRQRGAFDFATHYDNLCALQNSCPLPAVKAHLPDGVLDINGDRVRYSSFLYILAFSLLNCYYIKLYCTCRATDWVPVLNTVRINKTLELIAVRSYYQQVLEEGIVYIYFFTHITL